MKQVVRKEVQAGHPVNKNKKRQRGSGWNEMASKGRGRGKIEPEGGRRKGTGRPGAKERQCKQVKCREMWEEVGEAR